MIRNVLLAIVLAVQLGVLFVVDPPWEDDAPATEGLADQRLSPLPLAEIGRIAIADPTGKALELVRQEGTWIVVQAFGYPAKEGEAQALVDELEALPRAVLRSDKKVMHDTFAVDEAHATRLRLSDATGRILATLLVGKRDLQGVQGTFIRLEGDDRTWALPSASFPARLRTDARTWYDPVMMDISAADQARMTDLRDACFRIEIESNAEDPARPGELVARRLVYERRDGGGAERSWSVVEPEEKSDLVLDDLLLKSLISQIVSVRALELVAATARPEFGFDDPDAIRLLVTARFREGGVETIRTIEVGAPIGDASATPTIGRGAMRYARTSHPGDAAGQGFVFAVSANFTGIFDQPPERFQRREVEKPPGDGR
ncbi:MAG: DUF4340 domain-containing protein [Planctomycetota bacterium]